MNSTTKAWRLLRAWHNRRRVQVRLTLRVTVAAVLSLAIAQVLKLPLPLWAVLTALIVTQMSVGKSLKATLDYLIGTLGGAIYGGAIAVLVPHSSKFALLAVLALAVAPLALLATANPRLTAAPVTAVIVLLVPTFTHATPIASVLDRVSEVAVGAATGFVVSFLLLPSRAYAQAVEETARVLDHMARALRALLAGLTVGRDTEALHRIQDGIGQSIERLRGICAEAEHERAARIAAEPHTGPLLRTLLRLRHDLVMIGRAAQVPLPSDIRARLVAPLEKIAAAGAEHLAASARALRARSGPAPLDPVEAALDAYSAQVTAIRAEGLTRGLAADAAERFFALGFALDQMRPNLKDLDRCVTDWAEEPQSGT